MSLLNCSCHVKFPNSFTPNGDGVNETFRCYSLCDFKKYELSIFDRWGERVYYTESPEASWNGKVRGKAAPSETYKYTLVYQSVDPFDQEEHQVKGSIYLIR